MNHQTKVKGEYHDLIGYLETTIDDDHGGGVYAGSADLQRRLPGKGWKTVKHDGDGTDGIGFGSYGSHATGNVEYRVHYLGGTDPNTEITYAPSFSNTVVVTTLWKIKDTSGCPFNTRHCHLSGKLIPTTKHHKITLQVKHGKQWRKVKTVHSNAKGKYSVTVTATRKQKTYRLVIAKTKHIVATAYGYKVKLNVV
jgi:hypothetical protein